MADYYEVLRRALAGLQRNTGEARRGVYEKARQALVRQLDGFDPPLPPTEVTRQRLALEECIRKVEAEAARQSLGLSTPNPLPTQAPQHAAPAAPFGQPDPYQQPAPAYQGGQQQPNIFAPPQPAAYSQPALSPANLGMGSAATAVAPPPPAPNSADIFRQAIAEAEALGGAATEAARQARQVFDEDPHAHGQWQPQEHHGGNPFAEDEARQRAATAGKAHFRSFEDLEDDDGYGSDYSDEIDTHGDYDRVQPSRLPQIMGIAVVALVVLGIAAFAYSQRDVLLSFLDTPTTTAEPETAGDEETDTAATDGPRKTTDRLLTSKTGEGAGSTSAETGTGSAPTVRRVPTTKVIPPSTDGDDLSSATGGEGTAKDGEDTKTASADGGGTASDGSGTSAVTAAVAQRSVLYEQGGEGGGRGYDGQVTWTVARETPADSGGKERTVLKIHSFIEKRGVEVSITMRKNFDPALPASHLIEVVFKLPEKFAGKGIGDVPAMLMKPSEESRGDPLGGITARIGRGMFWIGLSKSDRDWERNRKLLTGRDWIDVPILYENGQKALLTLEKGIPGKRAIEQAVAAWDAAG